MLDLFRRDILAVAVLMWAAAALGAAEKELFPMLPADSAAVFGAEISALCEHPQGALVLSMVQDISDVPVEMVEKAVLACNKKWNKWSLIVRTPEHTLDKLCSRIYRFPEPENGKRTYPRYLYSGEAGDRRAIHLLRLSECDAGVIYPAFRHSTAIESGELQMRDRVRTLLPRRTSALVWGAVIPESEQIFLQKILSISFVLENQISGKLRLHGKIICQTPQDASAALFLMQLSIPTVMESRFKVPAKDSSAALAALDPVCKENIIYFSTENFETVLKAFLPLFSDRVPGYPKEQ